MIQNNTDSLISTDKIILDKIKTVKSQNIINDLLDYSNFYFSADVEDLENLYNQFMKFSTNENYKAKLTEKYNKLKLQQDKLIKELGYKNNEE